MGKVDEAAAGIGAYQFYIHTIANVEASLALYQHAVDARSERPHKSSVLVHAGHNGTELIADPIGERYGCDPLDRKSVV